jgi:hypothetical protein
MHALDQTQSVPEGHCRKSQTATVTPAKPGDYPIYLFNLNRDGIWTLNTAPSGGLLRRFARLVFYNCVNFIVFVALLLKLL